MNQEYERHPHLVPLGDGAGRAVLKVAECVRTAGGIARLVGGCVRDALLRAQEPRSSSIKPLPPKDFDIEVFGLGAEALEQVLTGAGFRVEAVGRSFGVFLLKGYNIDVSLPRRERKEGSGHKGFAVEGDPTMTPRDAAARRDFTINAILWDPLSGELLDPFGGIGDLKRGRLRHTSSQFSEDPLRVLRAMQFTARFEFPVARETVELCRGIEPEGLPAERLFEEWCKLLLKGQRPSLGLFFLQKCGWLRYFPELDALVGCPQEPEWHPEGDVFTHTALCLDAFAQDRLSDGANSSETVFKPENCTGTAPERDRDREIELSESPGPSSSERGDTACNRQLSKGEAEFEDLVVGFAVLCHDMGKPATTEYFDGKIRSHEHEHRGEEPARRFLGRITRHKKLIEDVIPLVKEHMRPRELYLSGAGANAVRRLARRVGRIDRLIRVARADMRGRPPLPPAPFKEGEWLRRKARELAVADRAPEPIVKGRHLIELGEQPGPHFKQILDQCYEAQTEGEFEDEAGGRAYLERMLDAENKSASGKG